MEELKTCGKGHQYSTNKRQCPKCACENSKKWQKSLPKEKKERLALQKIAWKKSNADKVRESNRLSRQKNRSSINQAAKLYYLKNKEKLNIKARKWTQLNPEKAKASFSQWKHKNPTKYKESLEKHRQANLHKFRANTKKWIKENPAKMNALNAKRRAKKLKATPHWLTKQHHEQIEFFYACAKDLEQMFGTKWHVDHITPLQHPDACGLHVPWNLQVIRAEENLKKGNKLIKASNEN